MPEGLSPLDRRRIGVLLHPTSLPGAGPCGTLGREARRFVDLLADSGFSVWQVLPLGPVDSHRSPYQLRSAFAGNPALVDPGLVAQEPWWPAGRAVPRGSALAAAAWNQFRKSATPAAKAEFERFRASEAAWLMPYAMFEVLGARFGGRAWWDWPAGFREHSTTAMRELLHRAARPITVEMFGQFLFHKQWRELRSYARERGVYLFGDLPFYVDRNSADVWWLRANFLLNGSGAPEYVAGVPPDYFNADGQLWGNPVYDWQYLQQTGFHWWLARLGHQARWFDLLRLDHFRALESCWVVPAGARHARDGRWESVPGDALLAAVAAELPELRLVAEDLGTITPAVTALRERHRLPGMLVLQFAFDGSPDNPYLPGNQVTDAVVYTGTHDNDTTLGWYRSLPDAARSYVDQQLGGHPEMPDALVVAACQSPARLAVIPFQDLLRLGSEARMNIPGTTDGNWNWRFSWQQVDAGFVRRCLAMATAGGRVVPSVCRQRSAV